MFRSRFLVAPMLMPLFVVGLPESQVGAAGDDGECYVVPGSVKFPLDACGAASISSALFNAVQVHELALDNLTLLLRYRDSGEISHEVWVELAETGAEVLDGIVDASNWAYLSLLSGSVGLVEYQLPHSGEIQSLELMDLSSTALGLESVDEHYERKLMGAVDLNQTLQEKYWRLFLRLEPHCKLLLENACEF